jgi:hypothetical protein
MEESNQNICPVCHQPVTAEFFFCPNCGHNLKEKPMPISTVVQIGLYALAIFLPPLGLWPGIKYMMKNTKQAKWVGGVTIALTLLSSFLTIYYTFSVFSIYIEQINELTAGI